MQYVVVDNILEDPEYYIEWAQTLSYDYTAECTSMDIKRRNLCTDQGWRGFRSNEITTINADISTNITTKIYQKALHSFVNKPFVQTNYMHFLGSDIVYDDSWWHPDASDFAGVIYLNLLPEPNSGTLIKINDNIVQIDNVFNRLLLYDAKLVHRPQKGFGNNLIDTRLTITFFTWLAPNNFYI